MLKRSKPLPDGVPAEGGPLDVLVDAAAVVGEVGEDGEGGLDGPVLHQLHLDLLDAVLHRVPLVAVGLVGAVVLGVAGLARLVAPGRAAALLAGPPGAVDVVLAGLDLVGLAAVVRAVEAARDEALLVPELPGRAGEAAVAAEAAGEAAGKQVLGAHLGLDVLVFKDMFC